MSYSYQRQRGWDLHACADRMIELGELRELTGPEVDGQDRVFVRRRAR